MDLLSENIKQEKGKLGIKTSSPINEKWLTMTSEPSLLSVGIFFLVAVLVHGSFVVLINSFCYSSFFKINESAGDILQAIVTLMLGLLIFIAERFREDKYTTRVFLRESKLWGLTVFVVLTLMFYFLSDFIPRTDGAVKKASVLVGGLLLIWLLYSIAKILTLVLSPDRLKALKESFLYKKIGYLNDLSITKRIGQNLFYQRFKNNGLISFDQYSPEKHIDQKYNRILAKKTGYITDINFEALSLPVEQSSETQKMSKIILRKSFGDKVQEGDILALVEYKNYHNKIYKFYRIDMGADVKAIKSELSADFKELLYEIGDVIMSDNSFRLESFYELLSKYIIKHSEGIEALNIKLDINKPNDAIGGFLDEGIGFYDEIQDILWDIYNLTEQSNNGSALLEFVRFIYGIAFYAGRRDDFPLIHISSRFIIKLFGNKRIQDNASLASRIKTDNENYLQFTIYPRIEENENLEEKTMFINFLVKLFRSLLKVSVDNNSISDFDYILGRMRWLDRYEKDEGFQETKQEMLFGFTGWLFLRIGKCSQDNPSLLFYKELIVKILSQFNCTFPEWLNLFIESRGSSKEDSWSTADWDLPHDGEVHMVDSTTGPEKLFLLGLFRYHIEREINLEGLTAPTDVRYLDLDKWLDDTSWIAIFNLGNITPENIAKIKKLILDLKSIETEQSKQTRIISPLSPERTEKFLNDIRESYQKSSYFYNNLFNVSRDGDIQNEQMYGYNVFLEKVWFVDAGHSIIGLGESYGKGFGDGQEKLIIDSIKRKAKVISLDSGTDLKQKILDLSEGMSKPVIIIYGTENYELLPKLLGKSTVWSREDRYRGEIENIKVYESFDSNNDKSDIILFDLDKIEHIIFKPSNPTWKKYWGSTTTIDGFYFELENISENSGLLQEILENPPEWLAESLKNEGYASPEEYLMDRVLFKMFFSYEIKISDQVGYVLKNTY